MNYEKPQILTEELIESKQLYAICTDTAALGTECTSDVNS
jgi:hypothetical protein